MTVKHSSFILEASLNSLRLLELNVDRADVGGAHGGEAEVAPPPLSLEHHPGVELEQTLDVPEDGRRHAQQLARHTCPGAHVPRDRRVEPVIVPRVEIDDHLIQARVLVLKQRGRTRVLDSAAKELWKTVVDPLDLLEAAAEVEAGKGHCAVCGAHEAAAWGQRPTSWTQPPAEEGGEAGVGPEAVGAGLGHVTAEHEAVDEDGDEDEDPGTLGLRQATEMAGDCEPGQRAVTPNLTERGYIH